MMDKRMGRQSYRLTSKPYVIGNAAIVGQKEGEGPLAAHFDRIVADEHFGQDTFEQAERQFYQQSIAVCLQKARVQAENVGLLLGGDLLNQITCASFTARELGIPFLGLYGACSTMAESLCIGGMLLDGGFADNAVCAASSHFCTAERQYRFPLEFGSQRTPTAQWTVTGAGASLLSRKPTAAPLARLRQVAIGRVVDLGVSDANNMGAAMAPAAADTLCALFEDTNTEPTDYPLILTGDLGQVGHDLLLELMLQRGHPLDEKRYTDCGLEIYARDAQDMHAGGSGCGCSATVLNAVYLPKLQRGELTHLLFMATGALLSPTTTQQGESIPGIAHAVVLEAPSKGADA